MAPTSHYDGDIPIDDAIRPNDVVIGRDFKNDHQPVNNAPIDCQSCKLLFCFFVLFCFVSVIGLLVRYSTQSRLRIASP